MKKRIGLTTKIFIGLILGIIVGVMLYPNNHIPVVDKFVIGFIFELIGGIFIKSIKMMVVPLVFVSLVCGVYAIGDIKKLGRVGIKTLSFYIITTAVAITIAIGLANIINPGAGLSMGLIEKNSFTIKESKPFVDVLLDMVPSNPIESLAAGKMLQIIVFAMLTGAGITILGEKVESVKNFFEELNVLVLKIVDMIMIIAPVGVFCLVAKTFSTLGYDVMLPLGKYMITIVLALLIHALVVYQGMFVAFTRLNPIKFFKKFSEVISVAFSTASSSASIPVTLETVQNKIGVSKNISSFTIPLGATINMDGTAIMQGVATVFIAQIYGVPLGLSDYAVVIATATLASIGTAGVPGVGLIMLSMVLTQVGIPVEGIALIIGIDRILDMCRTAVNVTGDAICTTIVAKSEGEFDEKVFNEKVFNE